MTEINPLSFCCLFITVMIITIAVFTSPTPVNFHTRKLRVPSPFPYTFMLHLVSSLHRLHRRFL